MRNHKLFSLIVIVMVTMKSWAQPAGTQLYYGLLHAHTLFSDGSGTPAEAFQKAKDAGLNFFAVTEHNHSEAENGIDPDRRDGILIANNHLLYNGTSIIPLTVTLQGVTQNMNVKSVKKAAEDATTSTFLALYGQEFSTISFGNHLNVINANDVIEIPKGEFKQFYDWVQSTNDPSIILQMNHPGVHADMFYQSANKNDYGIDETALGSSFSELVTNTDKYIQLIEMLSGPATSKTSNPGFHYPKVHENDYYFYLKQGFHIAPSAGQDNHYKTWGLSSSARIGVYATALNKNAIAEAIRLYRTFATEDKNLSVVFSVNGSPMGSIITAGIDQALNMEIKITDADDPSPVYTIEIYGGNVEPRSYAQATKLFAEEGLIDTIMLTGNGTATSSVLSSGDAQFYYIKVIENDGDRAWSAPIWINHPEAGVTPIIPIPTSPMFFWTRSTSSQVYHMEGCSSINTITPANLRSGTTAPEGRNQHACHIQNGGGH